MQWLVNCTRLLVPGFCSATDGKLLFLTKFSLLFASTITTLRIFELDDFEPFGFCFNFCLTRSSFRVVVKDEHELVLERGFVSLYALIILLNIFSSWVGLAEVEG